MFNFEYKITDGDVKSVNKSLMWSCFVPYIIVALVGIAAGVIAVVFNPRTEIFVFGILLLVFGGILVACCVLMLIAPSNFVASALMESDELNRHVVIDGDITIKTEGQEDIHLAFCDLTKVKTFKDYLLAYIDKDRAVIVKNCESEGKTLKELALYIKSRSNSYFSGSEVAKANNEPKSDGASEVQSDESNDKSFD